MNSFKIIQPRPGHRGVTVQDLVLTNSEAQRLALDPMTIVLLIMHNGLVVRVTGRVVPEERAA